VGYVDTGYSAYPGTYTFTIGVQRVRESTISWRSSQLAIVAQSPTDAECMAEVAASKVVNNCTTTTDKLADALRTGFVRPTLYSCRDGIGLPAIH
jgi:hypothetical protein